MSVFSKSDRASVFGILNLIWSNVSSNQLLGLGLAVIGLLWFLVAAYWMWREAQS